MQHTKTVRHTVSGTVLIFGCLTELSSAAAAADLNVAALFN
jgi:hypothetical protein